MLTSRLRGPRVRNHHSDHAGDSKRMREPGFFAWPLLGALRASRFPKPSRRPNRGDLPDVDFSRAEVDAERRRTIFWLLLGGVALPRFLRPAGPVAAPETLAEQKPVGETGAAPYIRVVESDESVAPVFRRAA